MEEEKEQIRTLSEWDFPDRKYVSDGYEMESVPEATSKNIVVLMNKINELIEIINQMRC